MTAGSAALPTISVALATRNGSEFIAEQLTSILRQIPAPLEVVVSDDASTDNTVSIIRAVFSEVVSTLPVPVPTLAVLENSKALGVTANFEQACRNCVGDLIALSDQDDVWREGRLRRFAELFASRPELLLANSDASLIDDRGRTIGASLLATIRATRAEKRALAGGAAFDVLIRRNLVTGATVVFRRELLERSLPFEPSWVHDEWLAIIGAATGRLGFIDKPLIQYRLHSSNQIGASRLTLARGVARLQTPRADRNARLLSHATTLVARLAMLEYPLHAGVRESANGKLKHERFRSGLPARRAARVVPVLRAAVRGDYRRYSRGATDAFRDLIQPL